MELEKGFREVKDQETEVNSETHKFKIPEVGEFWIPIRPGLARV